MRFAATALRERGVAGADIWLSLERSMKCADGPLRALPARPAVRLQGRPRRAPRPRRASAWGCRGCDRAQVARRLEVRLLRRLPAVAAGLRGRAAAARRPSSTSPTSSRPGRPRVEGTLRPLDRRGLDHHRRGRRAHPRDPRALQPPDHDRRLRRGRRDPGAAQLRRRRGLHVDRLRQPRVRLDARRRPRRRAPTSRSTSSCRAARPTSASCSRSSAPSSTSAGPRSPRTASASSASGAGNVCVMVAHGTPCLGPGHARRLRRAVPELPPRLLRLLRADGGAEPARALADHLGLEERDVVRLYRTFYAGAPAFGEPHG